ncbi:ankyrin repeat domain-containing protein [Pedobacter caeni]|uniref:Ankyrin repeat-containing protein n=1 Tax=Pedobacter caeni TaxID=288992 RepID=A0A1M4UCW7_9SPHI|nr:ankyrin repeat domain-containing protein [Pedobacter caeni]SHE54701.1 Ankyrin repeat-containing protein [Pedobacter caeni]
MKKLIDNKDYKGIEEALSIHPELANEGLPYDHENTTKAHPLHRLCDGVFSGQYTEEEAIKMAGIFLAHGANIDGNEPAFKQDSPLTAASSLNADQVAFFYMENGASIHHAGCHGGTALHWAAWCGRSKVVKKLIEHGAEVNKRCIDFKSTPLFWAVHALKNGGSDHLTESMECIKILIQNGADKKIPNDDGENICDLLNDEDVMLKELLQCG